MDPDTVFEGDTITLTQGGTTIYTYVLTDNNNDNIADELADGYLTFTLGTAELGLLSDSGGDLTATISDQANPDATYIFEVDIDTAPPAAPTVDVRLEDEVYDNAITKDTRDLSGTAVGADYVLVTVVDDVTDAPGALYDDAGNTATYKVEVHPTDGTWTLDLDKATPYAGSAIAINNYDNITVRATAYDEAGNQSAVSSDQSYVVDSVPTDYADPTTINDPFGSNNISGLEAFDRDGDGDLDLLGVGSSVFLYDNDNTVLSSGSYPESTLLTGLIDGFDLAVGDVNNDGRMDFAAQEKASSGNTTIIYDGLGTQVDFAGNGTHNHVGVEFMDYDNDGDLDMVTGSTSGAIYYENDGYGNFSSVAEHTIAGTVNDIYAFDLDGTDDSEDLLIAADVGLYLLVGDEGGSYDAPVLMTGAAGFGLDVSDFDRDGDTDIVVGNGEQVLIHRGVTTGGATDVVTLTNQDASYWTTDVAFVDYNADGLEDIVQVRTNNTNSKVTVWITADDGTPGFTTEELYDGPGVMNDVLLYDYNNDGVEDLVFADSTGAADFVQILGGAGIEADNRGSGESDVGGFNEINAQTGSATLRLYVDPGSIFGGDEVILTQGGTEIARYVLNDPTNSGVVDELNGDHLELTLTTAQLALLSDSGGPLTASLSDGANPDATYVFDVDIDTAVPATAPTVDAQLVGESVANLISDATRDFSGTAAGADYVLVTISDDATSIGANVVDVASAVTYKVMVDHSSSDAWTLDLERAVPYAGTAISVDNLDSLTVTATAYDEAGNKAASTASEVYTVDTIGPDFREAEKLTGLPNEFAYYGNAVDFDGDGDKDLTSNGTMLENRNTAQSTGNAGTGSYVESQKAATGSIAEPQAIHAGDIDSDGTMDLVSVNGDNIVLSIAGQQSTEIITITNLYAVELLDFDGDGDLDLAAATTGSPGQFYYLANDGYGNFETVESFDNNSWFTVQDVEITDVDGDGTDDMVVGDISGRVIFGSDSGNFTEQEVYSSSSAYGGTSTGVTSGDLDQSGGVDLIYGLRNNDLIVLRDVDGSGNAAAEIYLSGSISNLDPSASTNDVVVMDYDGDGEEDIVQLITDTSNDDVAVIVWFTEGGNIGASSEVVYFDDNTDVRDLVVYDYNNDGIDDLVFIDYDPSADESFVQLLGGVALEADNRGAGLTDVKDFNKINAETTSATIRLRVDPDSVFEGDEVVLWQGTQEIYRFTLSDNDDDNVADELADGYLTFTLDQATINSLDQSGTAFTATLSDGIHPESHYVFDVDIDRTPPAAPSADGQLAGESVANLISVDSRDLSGTAVGADYVLVTVHDDATSHGASVVDTASTVTYKVEVDPSDNDSWTLDMDEALPYAGTPISLDNLDSLTVTATAYDEAGNKSAVSSAEVYTVDTLGPDFRADEQLVGVLETELGYNVNVMDYDGDGDKELSSLGYVLDNKNQPQGSGNDGMSNYDLITVAASNLTSFTTHAGDIDSDGTVDLVSRLGDTIHLSVGGLQSLEKITSSDLESLRLLDFDGDGDLDIASLGVNNVAYLENDGYGNFTTLVSFDDSNLTQIADQDIAVFDVDGDGTDDLIVSDDVGTIIFGSSSGNYVTQKIYEDATSLLGGGAAVGDLDGSGVVDIVYGGPDNQIYVLQNVDGSGNVGGTLELSASFAGISPGVATDALAILDYDGDGDEDIVQLISDANGSAVVVWYGEGGVPGASSEVIYYDPTTDLHDLTIYDYNNDGIDDLVFVDNDIIGTDAGFVQLLGGAGLDADNRGGGLTDVKDFNTINAQTTEATLRLRVDPATVFPGDTITVTQGGTTIYTYTLTDGGNNVPAELEGDYLTFNLDSGALGQLSDSGGALTATLSDGVHADANYIFEVDIDRAAPVAPTVDGLLAGESTANLITVDSRDLSGTAAGADYVLVTVVDDATASFDSANTATYKVEVDPSDNDSWTLDLDKATPYAGSAVTIGNLDMLTVTATAYDEAGNRSVVSSAEIYEVDSIGPEYQAAEQLTGALADEVAHSANAFDYDGDGDIDLASNRYILTNDGTGNYVATLLSAGASAEQMIRAGDIDSDGTIDLVSIDGNDIHLSVGGLASLETITLPDLYSMELLDFDGDGDLDIAAMSGTGTQDLTYYLENDGYGNFATVDTFDDLHFFTDTEIEIIDLDGDGTDDLLLNDSDEGYVVLGSDSGAFTKVLLYDHRGTLNLQTSFGVAAGDLDGSGVPDIVFGADSNQLIVLQDVDGAGVPAATLALSASVAGIDPGVASEDVVMIDYDGDGDDDIIQLLVDKTNNDSAVIVWYSEGGVPGASSELIYFNDTVELSGLSIFDYNNDGIDDLIFVDSDVNNDDSVVQLMGGAGLEADNRGAGLTEVKDFNTINAQTTEATLRLRVNPDTVFEGDRITVTQSGNANTIYTYALTDGNGDNIPDELAGDYLTLTLDSNALGLLDDSGGALTATISDGVHADASYIFDVDIDRAAPSTPVIDQPPAEETLTGIITSRRRDLTGTAADADYVLVTVHDDDTDALGTFFDDTANTATYRVQVHPTNGTWTLDLDKAVPYAGTAVTMGNFDNITLSATAYDAAGNKSGSSAPEVFLVDSKPSYADIPDAITAGLAMDVSDVGDLQKADIDGDGDMDLIVGSGSNNIETYLYINNNAFGETGNYAGTLLAVPTGQLAVSSIAAGDLDSDGLQDIVTSGAGSGAFTRVYKEGLSDIEEISGRNSVGGGITVGSNDYTFTSDLELVDYDNDGDLDLVQAFQHTTGLYSGSYDDRYDVIVYENDGLGNYTDTVVIGNYVGVADIQAFDADGDGRDDDILISGGDVSRLEGYLVYYTYDDSAGTFGENVIVNNTVNARNSTPTDLATGDIDGDGTQEVAYGLSGFGEIHIWEFGSSGPSQIYNDAPHNANLVSVNIALVDYDGNGMLDIIQMRGRVYDSEVVVSLTGDDGTIGAGTSTLFYENGAGVETFYHEMEVYDYNNDGIDDLIFGTVDPAVDSDPFVQLLSGASLDADNRTAGLTGPGGFNAVNTHTTSATLRLMVDEPSILPGNTVTLSAGSTVLSTKTLTDGNNNGIADEMEIESGYILLDLDQADITALTGLGDGMQMVTVSLGDSLSQESKVIRLDVDATAPTNVTIDDTVVGGTTAGEFGSIGDKLLTGTAQGADFVMLTVHDDDTGGGGSGGTVTYKVMVDHSAGDTWTLDLDSDNLYQGAGSVLTYDLNDNITVNATAYDSGGNATSASAASFTVVDPFDAAFASETIYNALGTNSNRAYGMVAGDFDGDGNDDLVGFNTSDDFLSVYSTDGVKGSTNVNLVTYPAASRYDAIDAGDVTGDGIDDIVAFDSSENLIIIQGDGTVQSTNLNLPTSTVRGVLTLDFDGDGDLDLAVGMGSNSGQELYVYTNDGAGNFNLGYTFEVGNNVTGFTTGDFNQDGKDDLVITTGSSGNQYIMTSTSTTDNPSFDDNVFSTEDLDAVYTQGIAVDFLGSNTQKQDVVVGDKDKFTIFYDMEDNGNSASSSDVYFEGSGEDPLAVEIMDYDGDGNKDIIALYNSSSTGYDAAAFLTDADGQITDSFIVIDESGSGYVAGIAVLDYNNDGIDDLMIAATTGGRDVLVLRGGATVEAGNKGTSTGPDDYNQLNADSFTTGADLVLYVDPATIIIGLPVYLYDSSGNLLFEYTAANDGTGNVDGLSGDHWTIPLDSAGLTAIQNLGDGTHQLRVEMPSTAGSVATASLTLEQLTTSPSVTINDTIPGEAVAGAITDDSVQINGTATNANYLLVTVADDGAGSSANTATYEVIPNSVGNWELDLRATPVGGSAITIDHDDTFTITATAYGDMNTSGTAPTASSFVTDLFPPTLTPSYTTDDYYTFDWPITGSHYRGAAFGDVNGDGNLDLSIGRNDDASVFYGNSDGTFDPTEDFVVTTPNSARVTHLVDLNGDGYDDMVVIDDRYVYTVLAKSDGSGFESSRNQIYDSGNTSYFDNLDGVPINTGDFNGDGNIDFSFANSYSTNAAGGLYVFMGNGSGTSFNSQFVPINDSQFDLNSVSAMGDVDNDGTTDMVYFRRFDTSNFEYYLTVTDGQNSTTSPLDQNNSMAIYTGYDGGTILDLQMADINGDGWQDVAFTHRDSTDVEIYFNTQSATGDSYSSASTTVLDVNAILGRSDIDYLWDLDLIDIDSDGDTDILLGVSTSNGSAFNEMIILTQNPDGSFSEQSTTTFDRSINGPSLGRSEGRYMQYEDFDGNGMLDMFIMNRDQDGSGGSDPRIHWGRTARITDGGTTIDAANEQLTIDLGGTAEDGDIITINYGNTQIASTVTLTSADVTNGTIDVTLDNVAGLYDGAMNQITVIISDPVGGGAKAYEQAFSVDTSGVATNNSYLLFFGTEADTINGFSAGDGAGGDKMNISNILSDIGYIGAVDWNTLETDGYISRADDGSGNTIISVDKDGGGDNLEHVLTLNGVTAANLDDDDLE